MKRSMVLTLAVAGLALPVWQPLSAQQAAASSGPSIAVNGTLRLQTDEPSPASIVQAPFAVGGWALDRAAPSGTGIDGVAVWAVPLAGPSVFLGNAGLGGSRPDVAAVYGAQFVNSGFNLTVTTPLMPGPYILAVFGHSIASGTYAIVDQTTIIARGVTLSDLSPCTAGQVPQFSGTSWSCQTNPGAPGPTGPTGPKGDGRDGSGWRNGCHRSDGRRVRGRDRRHGRDRPRGRNRNDRSGRRDRRNRRNRTGGREWVHRPDWRHRHAGDTRHTGCDRFHGSDGTARRVSGQLEPVDHVRGRRRRQLHRRLRVHQPPERELRQFARQQPDVLGDPRAARRNRSDGSNRRDGPHGSDRQYGSDRRDRLHRVNGIDRRHGRHG